MTLNIGRLCLVFSVLVLGACSDNNEAQDNNTSDMAVDLPAMMQDMGDDLSSDMSADMSDGGMRLDMADMMPDLGPDMESDMMADMAAMFPLMGFGALSGECNVIDDELTTMDSVVVRNVIDFADDPYDMEDFAKLSMGGQEIITDGNAGGSSILSEVFSFEVLHRCESAILLKTETEITYKDTQGKITDLLVEIDGQKVGVSVTRAVKFPRDDSTMYSVDQAKGLLEKKLEGIIASSDNVDDSDKWVKQILHVLAYDDQHAQALIMAHEQIGDDIKKDTIIWITVTNGMDAFMY